MKKPNKSNKRMILKAAKKRADKNVARKQHNTTVKSLRKSKRIKAFKALEEKFKEEVSKRFQESVSKRA